MSYNGDLVGWKDTSRHFVNSISLSFPLPAHEFSYRPGPVSHVCSFSRLSIRKFLKHSSKRVLIVPCKMCWKNWKTERQQTRLSPSRLLDAFASLFSRVCWLAAIKCQPSICSWQTNCTTWSTIPEIKWFNAGVIMTSSNFGCNGEPR